MTYQHANLITVQDKMSKKSFDLLDKFFGEMKQKEDVTPEIQEAIDEFKQVMNEFTFGHKTKDLVNE